MKRTLIILVLLLLSTAAFSQGKSSEWKEVQTAIIPQSTKIYEGVTKGGNPKYWIEVQSLKVNVSPNNAEKFKSGKVTLELVKSVNSSTGKIKYSTRQVKQSKKDTPDIDITKLF